MLRFDLPNVHDNAVRVHAFISMLMSIAAIWIHPAFIGVLFLQGFVKGFFGLHYCPMYRMIEQLLILKKWHGAPEDMGAKMFAAKLLMVASGVAGALYVAGITLWMVPMMMIMLLSTLEYAFGFCIACYAYHYYFQWKQS